MNNVQFDKTTLQPLKRAELQKLAKTCGMRAVGTNKEIIQRLACHANTTRDECGTVSQSKDSFLNGATNEMSGETNGTRRSTRHRTLVIRKDNLADMKMKPRRTVGKNRNSSFNSSKAVKDDSLRRHYASAILAYLEAAQTLSRLRDCGSDVYETNSNPKGKRKASEQLAQPRPRKRIRAPQTAEQ